MIPDKLLIAFGDESFKFLTRQLSMVGRRVTENLGSILERALENGYHF